MGVGGDVGRRNPSRAGGGRKHCMCLEWQVEISGRKEREQRVDHRFRFEGTSVQHMEARIKVAFRCELQGRDRQLPPGGAGRSVLAAQIRRPPI